MIWETPDLLASCFIVAVLFGCGGYALGVLVAGGEWARQVAADALKAASESVGR